MKNRQARTETRGSGPGLLTVKSRAARSRIAVLILMALIEMSVTAGLGHVRLDSAESATLAKPASTQGPSVQCSPVAPKDDEFQPASWYTRSVARPGSSARNNIGSRRWQQTDVKSHSMRWESDAANTSNDFWIFEYKLNTEIKEVQLEVGGDRSGIEIFNAGGSGKEGGLMLAVYEGRAPETLFKGTEIAFGTPAFLERWPKPREVASKGQVEPPTVRVPIKLYAPVKFRAAVKEFSVVLAGVDPWIDARVSILICRLRVLYKPPYVPRSKK